MWMNEKSAIVKLETVIRVDFSGDTSNSYFYIGLEEILAIWFSVQTIPIPPRKSFLLLHGIIDKCLTESMSKRIVSVPLPYLRFLYFGRYRSEIWKNIYVW